MANLSYNTEKGIAHNHWHPYDVAVAEFMEGKRDYPLTPYRQRRGRKGKEEIPCKTF